MAGLLLSVLALSLLTAASARQQGPLIPQSPCISPGTFGPGTNSPRDYSFTLRHVFQRGTTVFPGLHRRLDVQKKEDKQGKYSDHDGFGTPGPFPVRVASHAIQRLANRRVEDALRSLDATQDYGTSPFLSSTAWTSDVVLGPNITDKDTVLNLALMAANAYDADRSDPDWVDVGQGFNSSTSFGWENDGLRGHVFADVTNSTIVISVKGTTAVVFDGADTTTNDKENDNLFGSCCCGEGGQYLWRQVCQCKTSVYTCNQTCLTKSLRKPNRYYQASLELYGNITELYPASDVILVGHSLGGVIVSLLGLTFGVPTVTFEAYGQALAAKRLGLPLPPNSHVSTSQAGAHTGGYHFGHTADPVYMGSCNGPTSFCTLAGFAFESACFTGMRCVYDVVKDWNWRQSIQTHSIRSSIRDVYAKYEKVPFCESDTECVDCALWRFEKGNGTDTRTSTMGTTTATSTSVVMTRTTTCETPGWFGCLDESTTTAKTSISSANSSTSTTATCHLYGSFGECLDTTSASTRASPSAAFLHPSSATAIPTTSG